MFSEVSAKSQVSPVWGGVKKIFISTPVHVYLGHWDPEIICPGIKG